MLIIHEYIVNASKHNVTSNTTLETNICFLLAIVAINPSYCVSFK